MISKYKCFVIKFYMFSQNIYGIIPRRIFIMSDGHL